jgi:hypothetical protein
MATARPQAEPYFQNSGQAFGVVHERLGPHLPGAAGADFSLRSLQSLCRVRLEI